MTVVASILIKPAQLVLVLLMIPVAIIAVNFLMWRSGISAMTAR